MRLLAIVLFAAGCRQSAPAPPATLPATVPTSMPVAELAGSAACAGCHRAISDAWSRSPHGRAMATASSESVRGEFTGGAIALPDGSVTPARQPEGFFMRMNSAAGDERRAVDLVLASGRQHQVYVTHDGDGAYSLLPIIWCTKTREWLPTALYQRGGLDPRSRDYFGGADLSIGCFSCHLSQAYRRLDRGEPESAWIDLSINCESCHGPGREHIRRRAAGRLGPCPQGRVGCDDEVLRDLRPLGNAEEARVCGQCHGFQLKALRFPARADGLPDVFVTSLINDALRPDGTQRLTSYQYPGHVLSRCFQKGALTCKGCHEPHGLGPRDFLGEPASGADSNRQCTVCHRDRATIATATRHSHHAAAIRCVDCHMAYSWIGDDEKRRQRTSDHSISIPRPRESVELGTPNACTTCHRDRAPAWALAALERWGYREAGSVREWVRTIALARTRAPGATSRLIALLDEPSPYLQASALDLLVIQPPDARLVPRLAPFAHSDDPQLRAIAIRALDAHDAAGRARWRELGLADAHPFVRMETFSLVKDVATLAPEAIARELADTLAYGSPPMQGLYHLVAVRHKRGELREALELLALVERVALPRERKTMHLADLRLRFESEAKQRSQR